MKQMSIKYFVFILFFMSAIISASTDNPDRGQNNSRNEDARLPLKELRIFTQVFEQVRRGYVDEVTDIQLLENAVVGLLLELDPHSAYLDLEEHKKLQESASGQYGGLGIEISARRGMLEVIAPIDDSPAQKAGIRTGDLIHEINGEPVRSFALPEAIDKLRGPKGSPIDLTILRQGEDKPVSFNIIRDIIYSSAVRSRLLPSDIGYVRISQFQENSDKDFVAALKKLNDLNNLKGGLKGLIIDLRNNPGGLIPPAVEIADVFLDDGVIVYTEGRTPSSNQTFFASPRKLLEDVPIVVLINGGTASAAEIVAGALQDHTRAAILGTQSFGKGSVQTVIPFGDGRAIKLTTARYFTPLGRSIQAEGIIPDIYTPRAEAKLLESKPFPRERDLDGHLTSPDGHSYSEQPSATEEENDNQLKEAVHILKGFNLLKQNWPLQTIPL
jgi:carboxyl-terminal processing protease